MPKETKIYLSTGSDNRFIAPEVIFCYLITALKGRSLSGSNEIIIDEDGRVVLNLEFIYAPKPRLSSKK